jgi:hypothetical protein
MDIIVTITANARTDVPSTVDVIIKQQRRFRSHLNQETQLGRVSPVACSLVRL